MKRLQQLRLLLVWCFLSLTAGQVTYTRKDTFSTFAISKLVDFDLQGNSRHLNEEEGSESNGTISKENTEDGAYNGKGMGKGGYSKGKKASQEGKGKGKGKGLYSGEKDRANSGKGIESVHNGKGKGFYGKGMQSKRTGDGDTYQHVPSKSPIYSPTPTHVSVADTVAAASLDLAQRRLPLDLFWMEYNINADSHDEIPASPTPEDIRKLRVATEEFYLSIFNQAFASDPNKNARAVEIMVIEEIIDQFLANDKELSANSVIMDLQLQFDPVLILADASEPVSATEAQAIMEDSHSEFASYVKDYVRPVGDVFRQTTHVAYQAIIDK